MPSKLFLDINIFNVNTVATQKSRVVVEVNCKSCWLTISFQYKGFGLWIITEQCIDDILFRSNNLISHFFICCQVSDEI